MGQWSSAPDRAGRPHISSCVFPKSADPARQIENADVFGIGLSLDEIAAVTGLQRGRLWDGDPDTHEEM
jgi:2,5-diketo-D-gluconate reductase A